MKTPKVLIPLVIGLVFVIFPRGQENTKVYDTCHTELCLLVNDRAAKAHRNGIPYTTILPYNHSVKVVARKNKHNEAKIFGNFAIGFASGSVLLTSVMAVVEHRKKL